MSGRPLHRESRDFLERTRLSIAGALGGVVSSPRGWRNSDRQTATLDHPITENPLRLGAAIRMAIAFQVAMLVVALVRRQWGMPAVFTTGVALGLTDINALSPCR